MLKLLPKGILGASGDGGQSYILEKSVVDVKEGWMKTETRNLEWTGILSIIERQYYTRGREELASLEIATNGLVERTKNEGTQVTTTVTLLSRFGQPKFLKKKGETDDISPITQSASTSEDEAPARKGFFSSWSTSSLQHTIEGIGLRRTRDALAKSKEGMNVVLARLRHGGLVQVLEGMQEDSHRAFGQDPSLPWKRTWRRGQNSDSDDQ